MALAGGAGHGYGAAGWLDGLAAAVTRAVTARATRRTAVGAPAKADGCRTWCAAGLA